MARHDQHVGAAAAEAAVAERQGQLEAERVHAEALTREMHTLAEHARGVEQRAQQSQVQALEVTREKDALYARTGSLTPPHRSI